MSTAIMNGAAMNGAIITVGNFGNARAAGTSTSRTARTSHLRITARGRAVLVALVAIPVIAVAAFLGINAGGADATSHSTPLSTVTVTPGETLWQVAEKIAPNSDPRDVIADIMRVNQLDTASIGAGEQLRIPAQYAPSK